MCYGRTVPQGSLVAAAYWGDPTGKFLKAFRGRFRALEGTLSKTMISVIPAMLMKFRGFRKKLANFRNHSSAPLESLVGNPQGIELRADLATRLRCSRGTPVGPRGVPSWNPGRLPSHREQFV